MFFRLPTKLNIQILLCHLTNIFCFNLLLTAKYLLLNEYVAIAVWSLLLQLHLSVFLADDKFGHSNHWFVAHVSYMSGYLTFVICQISS